MSVDQIKALLESEKYFIDHKLTGSEEEDVFRIPLVANHEGKTPYQYMHD